MEGSKSNGNDVNGSPQRAEEGETGPEKNETSAPHILGILRRRGKFRTQKQVNGTNLIYGSVKSQQEGAVLHDLMTIKLLGAQEAR
jgi:hypothetical protein